LGTSQLWTWITNKPHINWYEICIFVSIWIWLFQKRKAQGMNMYHYLFFFHKMISITSSSTYPCAWYIFAKTLYTRPTLVWTNFGWFFLFKERISSLNFNNKNIFGRFFMHVFKFNSSRFYTLHYWFWYLISNSKTCGSNLKIKSNLKIRFKMKAYYGEPKMFSDYIIFFKGTMFELQPCDYYEQWSIIFCILC
jgi:hypothetical protein